MRTQPETQAAKNTVINNIITMRTIIGVEKLSFEGLNKYNTLEELQEKQNALIKHYNQALMNTPKY